MSRETASTTEATALSRRAVLAAGVIGFVAVGCDAAGGAVPPGDDVARAVGRVGDHAATVTSRGGRELAAGARALARPARHPSLSAWAALDENKGTGRGEVRLGLYETASKKRVPRPAKVTVSSYRERDGGEPIHTEVVTFGLQEAVDDIFRKDTQATWRTWAGMAPEVSRVQFWTAIQVEVDGWGVPVSGETEPR
jgi:hypothetical protein